MISFRIDAGWNNGEPMRLVYVSLLEYMRGYLVILSIGVLKFSISVGAEW